MADPQAVLFGWKLMLRHHWLRFGVTKKMPDTLKSRSPGLRAPARLPASGPPRKAHAPWLCAAMLLQDPTRAGFTQPPLVATRGS